MLSPVDLHRAKLYTRLAAGFKAVGLVVLVALIAWLIETVFDLRWTSRWVLAPIVIAAVAAVAYFVRAELQVRSFQVDVSDSAVAVRYGRTRTYAPLEHVQLLDKESGLLLKRMGLSRIRLHTSGGFVLISPVPNDLATQIEVLVQNWHQAPAAPASNEIAGLQKP